MDRILDLVLFMAILLGSVVIHENAHGVVAYSLGDPTAKAAGRLTLNPIPHLDIVGSLILPAFLFFTAGIPFGYAKPVPITPSKLRGTDKTGFAVVALAGPASNVLLAFGAALLGTVVYGVGSEGLLGALGRGVIFADGQVVAAPQAVQILGIVFLLNVFLAAFNLIPVPPLDGSRLLRPFLSNQGRQRLDQVEPYGFLIILLLITLLAEPFFRVVDAIQSVILRLIPL